MTYKKVRLDIPAVDEYTVDTDGVIWNVTKDKQIFGNNISKTNRYKTVTFDKRYKVHRLVAEHLVPNPNPSLYTQVNHIDGDRSNNAASNLEWVTSSQNVKHAYSTGLKSNFGELNPVSILTEEIVVAIWRLSKAGHKPSQIIRLLKLNVDRTTVSSVVRGVNWKHITSKL